MLLPSHFSSLTFKNTPLPQIFWIPCFGFHLLLPPNYSYSLIICLSLSEDLSTSLQISLHPCFSSISRDINIQNPVLSSLIISVSMPQPSVYGHTLEMATLLKAWSKLPIHLVPFSSTHVAIIFFFFYGLQSSDLISQFLSFF